MSKKNCTTDTDANRTVNRRAVKVMSEQERSAEFLRVMKGPESDVFAQAKLERYFELVREWEAGFTDEELESMPDEIFRPPSGSPVHTSVAVCQGALPGWVLVRHR